MKPRPLAILLLVAGLVVIGGGFAGWASKGSIASLAAAGAAGAVWLASALGVARGRAWAVPLAGAVAFALAGVMGWRWASGGAAMPAAPVIAVSAVVLVALATRRRAA
jgi:uncharacterized membrane protein (UPF0136 family)